MQLKTQSLNQENKMKSLILLVDDDKDLLMTVRLLLEEYDYDVITAPNGKEALKLLSAAERLPDVILSDVNMPEMDGLEFFHYISENSRLKDIAFIFLTVLSSPEEVRRGKRLGVDHYLSKPFNKEDLLAVIEGTIARYRRFTKGIPAYCSWDQAFENTIIYKMTSVGPTPVFTEFEMDHDLLVKSGIFFYTAIGQGMQLNTGLFGPLPFGEDDSNVALVYGSFVSDSDYPRLKTQNYVLVVFVAKSKLVALVDKKRLIDVLIIKLGEIEDFSMLSEKDIRAMIKKIRKIK